MKARWSRRWIALAIVVAALVASPALVRMALWRLELNPYLRGRLIAEEQGCFNCHLPERPKEIPNPGSRWETVPRFFSGNAMMYSPDREGVEQFIRYGAPRDWLETPETRQRLADQHLRMPAYGGILGDGEIRDLVTYVSAIEKIELAGERDATVIAGRRLAEKHGCLACHGFEGSGGLPNPGSLGGFIPGFLGRNFTDLVADEAEFKEWLVDGKVARLDKNPLIRYVWRRQQLKMPSYREELTDEEIAQLWSWVTAVRRSLADGEL